MTGILPIHGKQGALKLFDLLRRQRWMCVKHTMIEARSGPKPLDFGRIDMTRCLFIHPNQIADCSRVRPPFVKGLEHLDLTCSRIAMFAEISVEGKKFHKIEVNTFVGNEV